MIQWHEIHVDPDDLAEEGDFVPLLRVEEGDRILGLTDPAFDDRGGVSVHVVIDRQGVS